MNIAAMVRHTWTQPCTVTSKHEKCRGASWKEIFPPKAKLPSMASSLQTKRESLHQSKDKGKLPTSRKAGRSLLNYPNLGQANKIIQFLKNAGNSCRNFSIPQKYYCAMIKKKPYSWSSTRTQRPCLRKFPKNKKYYKRENNQHRQFFFFLLLLLVFIIFIFQKSIY